MKKSGILNKFLNNAIASMGHGDFMMISDAGFPVPEEKRVDLAIKQDVPSIMDILELITDEMIYERVIVAAEQQQHNPQLFGKISDLCDRCTVETIPHAELLLYPPKVKFVVRTGAFEPWGNVILCSGVDAPKWFEKPGTSVPDYYEQRANYSEK